MTLNRTSNHQLFKMGQKRGIQVNNIIMRDEVHKIKWSGNYIINLNHSGQNGSHWTTFIIKNKTAIFIDSFGAIAPLEIIKYCMKNKIKLGYNSYIQQNLNAQSCGYYCLEAIKFLQHKNDYELFESANEFINLFVSSTKMNEKILLKMTKI